MAGKQAGCGDEHRGVAVVPAGVHLASGGRGEIEASILLQRQGVHVGVQNDRPTRLAAAQIGDY